MEGLTPEMQREAEALRREWETNPRWKGVRRDYRPEDVVRLRPSVMVEYTLAKRGAEKLWKLLFLFLQWYQIWLQVMFLFLII